MIPDRPDIRAALEHRSGEITPAFRHRLAGRLADAPTRASLPRTTAAAIAISLGVLVVAGLLGIRWTGQRAAGPPPASAPRVVATASTGHSDASPARLLPTVTEPADVRLSVASGQVVWGLIPGRGLYRSLNGGAQWEARPLPSDGHFPNPEISFVSDSDGWLFVGGVPATQCQEDGGDIWHTSDAGSTWELLETTGIASAQCKSSLAFVDKTHGYLSAWDPNHRPVIYASADGGRSWVASQPLPDPPGQVSAAGGFTLRPFLVSRRENVLYVGAGGWGHEYVYRSMDGGRTWSYAATVGAATDVTRVTFLDASTWWAVAAGTGQLVTRDAGRSWVAAPGTAPFAAGVPPSVEFADRTTGFATSRGAVARTDDGGRTWSFVATP